MRPAGVSLMSCESDQVLWRAISDVGADGDEGAIRPMGQQREAFKRAIGRRANMAQEVGSRLHRIMITINGVYAQEPA